MRRGQHIDQAKGQNGTTREDHSHAAPDQHKSEEIIVADTANSIGRAAEEANAAAIGPDLTALINTAKESAARLTLHSNEVLFPLSDQFQAARKDIPHFTSDYDEKGYWSTRNAGAVDFARRSIAKDPERKLHNSAVMRRLVAASIRRERAAKALRTSLGLMDAERESARLVALSIQAQDAVRDFPCRAVADLRAKVTFLVENEMVERDMGGILPDLDRIIAEGTSSHG